MSVVVSDSGPIRIQVKQSGAVSVNTTTFTIPVAVQSAPRATTYFGPTKPNAAGPFIWVQTGLGSDGKSFRLWFEDGIN